MQEIKEITRKCSASDYFSGAFLHNSDQLSTSKTHFFCSHLASPSPFLPCLRHLCNPSRCISLGPRTPSALLCPLFVDRPRPLSTPQLYRRLSDSVCWQSHPQSVERKKKEKRKKLPEIRAHRGAVCPSITSLSSSSNSLSAAQSLPCQNSISPPFLSNQVPFICPPPSSLIFNSLTSPSFHWEILLTTLWKQNGRRFHPFVSHYNLWQRMLYVLSPPKLLNFLCKLFVQLGATLGYLSLTSSLF